MQQGLITPALEAIHHSYRPGEHITPSFQMTAGQATQIPEDSLRDIASQSNSSSTNNECIFCVRKVGQSRQFCRSRKAREYVERQHLVFFGQDNLIPCPEPYCRLSGIVLFGHLHFKNHVSKVHGCSLLPYTLKGKTIDNNKISRISLTSTPIF